VPALGDGDAATDTGRAVTAAAKREPAKAGAKGAARAKPVVRRRDAQGGTGGSGNNTGSSR